MIIQINSLANPKNLGYEEYKQWLRKLTTKIQEVIPQASIYQPECDIDTLDNQVIIVEDTFSFRKGGHMRSTTHQFKILLLQSRQRNITFILLEPNAKHNWFIDSSTQIRCDGVGTFISLVQLAMELKPAVLSG